MLESCLFFILFCSSDRFTNHLRKQDLKKMDLPALNGSIKVKRAEHHRNTMKCFARLKHKHIKTGLERFTCITVYLIETNKLHTQTLTQSLRFFNAHTRNITICVKATTLSYFKTHEESYAEELFHRNEQSRKNLLLDKGTTFETPSGRTQCAAA